MSASPATSPRRQWTIAGVDFDQRLTVAVIYTTTMSLLDHRHYHLPQIPVAYHRFIVYLLIPLLIIHFVYKDSPKNYGFQLGRVKLGATITLISWLVMAGVLLVFTQLPSAQTYYAARTPGSLGVILMRSSAEMLGWEFVWRGFSLFTLAQVMSPGAAILLQAVPFAFMHLGKPDIETLSTIFGGSAFGLIAWRTRSYLYPALIHWFMISFTMVLTSGILG